MSPVPLRERIAELDLLRGFALFGVLLVNMGEWLPEPGGALDRGAFWLVEALAEGKFWPMLSLLFALGFTIQWGRAESRGERFLPLYLRRTLALALFALQMIFSVWWLNRFRFGPAEWVWKGLTYRRLSPAGPAPLPAPTAPDS